MKKIHSGKLFYILGIITFILFIGLYSYQLYQQYYPFEPIHYNTDKLKIINKQVKAGDTLEIVVDYCKNNDAPLKIYGQIANGIIYTVPPQERNIERGCHVINSRVWKVPEEIVPQKYHYQFTVEQRINDYRSIQVYIETEDFEVIK